MSIDFLKRMALLALLVLAHLLVLGHVRLWGVATPLLYVCIVTSLHRGYPKWGALLWGFVTGLAIDAVQNTPGMTAAALTLTAALQPYLLEALLPREAGEEMQPTAHHMGWGRYATYALLLTLIHCLCLFTLDFFTFFDAWRWFLCTVGSTLFTFVLLLTLQMTHRTPKPAYSR